ncbi:putative ATP-dependent RNA helicase DBP6 Ecym_2514 [Eremothecium cymbalariae DBVPG|uniref:ATP-dependent RNA helicase n=1 Tax=Eremothecium cymbalariae (strain CBS 270.75 / DBVPG 7215 / KCTC 17166 / NRRL Y-17582) TaxID=931890 RepID=G8JPX7_ERECY|nr:Hypothetical protein Ecym_2514 [Eremothecium cymbalariae DBVPG\
MFAPRYEPSKVCRVNEVPSKAEQVVPRKRALEDYIESERETEGDEDEDMNDAQESMGADEDDELEKQENGISEDMLSGDSNTEVTSSRHESVFSRFRKSMARQVKDDIHDKSDSLRYDDEESVPVHELAPIPQPAIVRDKNFQNAKSDHKLTAWSNISKIVYDNSMEKPFNAYKTLLSSRLLTNIESQFSHIAFPVQTCMLDAILPTLTTAYSVSKKNYTRKVGDILVNASTGSGKTLAYSIPIVHILSKRIVNRLRAIILVPTKLLIQQVYETILTLSQGTSLIINVSRLDKSLKEEHLKLQSKEPDILIVTPGRLVDHLHMSTFSLQNLKFLILDEADRLLNQSFQNWCSELMTKIEAEKLDKNPGNILKMIFSATLTTNTEKLHELMLHNPKLITMGTEKLYNMPKLLQEFNIPIPTAKSHKKPLILLRLLSTLQAPDLRVLVFVKSNDASIRLSSLLQIMINRHLGTDSIEVASINNNNSKALNKKLISSFSKPNSQQKTTKVLISTDLMSRGIDIINITHVINYDLPVSSQQYVHRCGRTARAHTHGSALNILVGKGELNFWHDQINTDISRDIEGYKITPFDGEKLLNLIKVDDMEEATYKDCLEELKHNVLGH